MAEKKKPSLFGKFFKGLTGDKVTSKEIQEAEGIVRRDPNNLRALHKLGDLYAKAEQFDKAIETYISAANNYIERAFYQKAVAVYKQILKIQPNRHEIQERLAEVYIELGRRSDALAQYQALARKHESSGSLSHAAEMILKMLNIDEENVPLRVKLAELYLAMQEKTLATDEFEKALNTLAVQEHWADYIKVGERLLFVAPEHLGALKTIARVYLDSGDVMKAMGKLQQAFKLDRRDPETLEVLAVAFDRLEQPEKTISVLKELAEIYDSMERFDYVRDVYQQILERDPNDAEIKQKLAVLPASPSSQALPATSQSRQALAAVGSSAALPAGIPVIKEPPPPPSRDDLPPMHAEEAFHVEAPPIPAAPPRTPPPPPRTAPLAPPVPPAPIIPAVEPSLSLSEEEIGRLLNEADVYIKYGLVPRVEEALNRVFAAEPSHPGARRLHVELLKMQERTEEAANELLALAKEAHERDPHDALTLLEQILELEDVSPALQEEAYQMSIRLSPKGSGATPSQPFASEPTMSLGSDDELDSIAIESFDELPVVEEPASFQVSQDDLEIISIDDLDAVEITDSQDDFVELSEIVPNDPPQEETQVIEDIDELEIVDDEVGAFPQVAATPPTFTPSAPAEPAPSLFAPPPKPEPADDAFGQFLRTRNDDIIEEDDPSDFKDFLSTPLVVETNSAPTEPTRSEGGEELSEMEAAAARLAALIKAKEESEAQDVIDSISEMEEEVVEEEAAPIPPPFVMPPAPAPFPTPPPASAEVIIDDVDEGALPIQDIPTSSLQEEDLFSDVGPELVEAENTFEAEDFGDEDFDLSDSDFGDLDDAFGDIQEVAEESYESLDNYEEIEALEFNPDDPFADDIEEASLYLDQDEPQYAIEIFDRILQQDPEHALAKAGIQLALEAESRIQKSTQQKADYYNLDAALGEIATTKRERDRVEGELKAFKEEAEKQFGEDGEALFELGIAYHGMMLYDMGIDSFKSCLRNEYRVFDSHKMIGACHTALGRNNEALSAYNDALNLPGITTEERLDVLFEMGLAYESAGDPAKALSCFEEVSYLDEQYRGVMQKIGAIQDSIGSL